LLTPISGRLFDKIGARYLVMLGMAINGIGTLMLAQINTDMSRPEIFQRG